jgi:type VI secretion system secreted protein Hcp
MAKVDYFLKLDGIDGESQDHKHKGEIDVLSFGLGVHHTGSMARGGGGGTGRSGFHDFHFKMDHSKASPALFLAMAEGKHIKSAKLTCRKAGGKQEEFMIVTFTDVLVTGLQTSATTSDHGNDSVESCTLNFAKCEFEYKEQKADGTLVGSVKKHWDQKINKGG